LDVRITAEDAGQGRDDALRSLLAWLRDVDELRGRVKGVESPPVTGTLGPVLDGLAVVVGPGGVATALTTAVVAWLRSRRSDVTLKVTGLDGTAVELSAKRVRLQGDQELRSLVDESVRALQGFGTADSDVTGS
jgi:hypothetical protein